MRAATMLKSVKEPDVAQFRSKLEKVHMMLDRSTARWKRQVIREFNECCSLEKFDQILIFNQTKYHTQEKVFVCKATQTESKCTKLVDMATEPIHKLIENKAIQTSKKWSEDSVPDVTPESLKEEMLRTTRSLDLKTGPFRRENLQAENKIEFLKLQLQEQTIKIHEQEKILKLLNRENEELSQRLHQNVINQNTSGDNVSDDSSMNDNMTDGVMAIAEEYNRVCLNEWQLAKQALDDHCSVMEEHEKIQQLHQIFEVAEGKTNELMDDVNMAIKCLIWKLAEPSLLQYKGSDIILQKQLQNKESRQSRCNQKRTKSFTDFHHLNDDETSFSGEVLPKEHVNIINAFGEYLKNNAYLTDLNGLKMNVLAALTENLATPETGDSEIMKLCKGKRMLEKQRRTMLDLPEVSNFIDKVTALAWKMVIQKPRVVFKFSDTYKGEAKYELLSGEECGLYEVYPLLYHGQKLLQKGKLYVKEMQKDPANSLLGKKLSKNRSYYGNLFAKRS